MSAWVESIGLKGLERKKERGKRRKFSSLLFIEDTRWWFKVKGDRIRSWKTKAKEERARAVAVQAR